MSFIRKGFKIETKFDSASSLLMSLLHTISYPSVIFWSLSLYNFFKGYFFAFTLPKIYDMYRKQIDANIKQIKNKYNDCYKRWVIIKLANSCSELEITVQKDEHFHEEFLWYMWTNLQFPEDVFTSTKEILHCQTKINVLTIFKVDIKTSKQQKLASFWTLLLILNLFSFSTLA